MVNVLKMKAGPEENGLGAVCIPVSKNLTENVFFNQDDLFSSYV